ncbi:DMT family transporter [Neisseria perflava]|uniref:DMT family transporter n=1 Tax=Neisseria perflava TaxID=33053 RepID=UPI00209E4220|nr:EamA family transporter [Neisseria perflava]MCP1659687.1 drug/metabolite transporter (DMT)-like permease [Neisseria perflava]
MNTQTTGMIQVVSGAVCWGTLGVLGATLNRLSFSGGEVAALRIVIAAVLLLSALRYFLPYLKQLRMRQLPFLAVQSFIGVLGMSLLYFAAVARVGSSLAVALLYTAPVWSLIFARMILGEGITRRQALLTVVAAAGVGLTMTGGGAADTAGITAGLGAGICYALYGVLGKRAMLGNPPMLVFFTSICCPALVLLLLPATHTAFGKLAQQDWAAWLSAIGMSLVGTVAAFFLFVKGLEKMSAAKAAVFTVFEPFTAVLLAEVFLDERLGSLQYAGVALIIAVAVLNATGGKKKTAYRK